MKNSQTKNNDSKHGITYEQLMESNFLKHPTHSKIVHTIFNPFIIAVIILMATTTYVKIADGDWTFALMVGFIASMFMSMKIAMATMIVPAGHGVGMVKKGKLSVLGLPTPAVVMLGIIFLTILGMNYVAFSYNGPLGGFERMKIFGVAMLFGFIMSICSWRFHVYYNMWYGSEYDARLEFKNKGYDDKEIESKVKQLKKQGILF
jgi:hypothetical protein